MSKMSTFISSASGMTQEPLTPEMKQLRALRNEWAALVSIPPNPVIDEIRAQLNSGPDQHGWKTTTPSSSRSSYGGGSRGGSGYQSSNTYNKGGGAGGGRNGSYHTGGGKSGGSYHSTTGGGAGGGSRYTAPVAAQAPSTPYVNRFSKPGTVASAPVPAPAPITAKALYKKKFSVQETPALTLLKSQINPLLSKINNDNFESVLPLLTNFLKCGGDLEVFLHSFMKMFMDIVVRNEMMREVFVRLIQRLRVEFPYLNEELDALYNNYTSIFSSISGEKVDDDDLDALDALNKAKEFRLGYSQFIAELMRARVISEERFLAILETVISNMELTVRTPDSGEKLNEINSCLIQMISIVGKAPASPIMDAIKSTFNDRLTALTVKSDELVSLTTQTRFTLKKCIGDNF